MAVTIPAITEQMIVINTDFMLNIDLTTDDTISAARVEGLLEGLYFNWVAASNQIQIRGETTRLIGSAEFTVYATDGDGEVSRSGLFHVVPAAPVITSVDDQQLIRGIENTIPIAIANSPTHVTASGPWVGLKSEVNEDGTGYELIGTVPDASTANLSEATTGTFRVTATNDGGTDTEDIDYTMVTVTFYGGRPSSGGQIIVFPIGADGVDIADDRVFTISGNQGQAQFIAVDNNYVYAKQSGIAQIVRYDRTTADGQTATASNVLSTDSLSRGIEVDSTYIYHLAGNRVLRMYNKSDNSQNKQFTLHSTASGVSGMAVDGTDLIVWDTTDEALYWFDTGTANNQTASIQKTVNLPFAGTGNDRGVAVYGEYIALSDTTADEIKIINKNTANNGLAEVLQAWDVPTEYRNITGLAIHFG